MSNQVDDDRYLDEMTKSLVFEIRDMDGSIMNRQKQIMKQYGITLPDSLTDKTPPKTTTEDEDLEPIQNHYATHNSSDSDSDDLEDEFVFIYTDKQDTLNHPLPTPSTTTLTPTSTPSSTTTTPSKPKSKKKSWLWPFSSSSSSSSTSNPDPTPVPENDPQIQNLKAELLSVQNQLDQIKSQSILLPLLSIPSSSIPTSSIASPPPPSIPDDSPPPPPPPPPIGPPIDGPPKFGEKKGIKITTKKKVVEEVPIDWKQELIKMIEEVIPKEDREECIECYMEFLNERLKNNNETLIEKRIKLKIDRIKEDLKDKYEKEEGTNKERDKIKKLVRNEKTEMDKQNLTQHYLTLKNNLLNQFYSFEIDITQILSSYSKSSSTPDQDQAILTALLSKITTTIEEVNQTQTNIKNPNNIIISNELMVREETNMSGDFKHGYETINKLIKTNMHSKRIEKFVKKYKNIIQINGYEPQKAWSSFVNWERWVFEELSEEVEEQWRKRIGEKIGKEGCEDEVKKEGEGVRKTIEMKKEEAEREKEKGETKELRGRMMEEMKEKMDRNNREKEREERMKMKEKMRENRSKAVVEDMDM
eukprot:TRINITY_DN1060_c0_g2_i2.p1 TRINITY_DN1060_c0_g2~~TRINITY_DN1060_c0_g2_i2.p1  ORF type:complete len:587 (-),score=236.75 TRINITY_DN1060_c0_g2_i2:467-2227(-)